MIKVNDSSSEALKKSFRKQVIASLKPLMADSTPEQRLSTITENADDVSFSEKAALIEVVVSACAI